MTWHLKDRELEKKLNELSNGEFSKILNESDMKNPNCICFTIDKKEDIELSVYLRPEAIEPEYDPHKWNLYPEVTPPQGAMMRIKYHDVTSKDRKVERGFALFDCGQWVSDSGYPKFPNNPQNYVIWFRPWIGPDEEGEE